MDKDELLNDLMQKYIDQKLSSTEREQLAVLLEEHPNLPAIEAIFRESYANSLSTLGWDEETKQIFVSQLLQKIITKPSSPKSYVLKISILRRIGWAAVLLLLLGSGIYVWTAYYTKDLLVVSLRPHLKNDVLPGKNGAILTLSNGRQVVLDSLGNGVISAQGNSIVKLDNGKVMYDKNSNNITSDIAYNTLSTPKGRQFQLVLPDGSKVWLNAGSSLTFPTAFIGGERKVSVTGEAYFEVAHNPQKPFRVQINEHSAVEVLGTHFNINAYADEPNITTTLLEGRINITDGNKNVLLTPGQQALLYNSKINFVSDADIDVAVSWKEGRFLFKEASLQSIMRQLSRWYDLEIVYNGNTASSDTDIFNGIIDRKANLSRILKILEKGGVRFKVQGNKLIVTP